MPTRRLRDEPPGETVAKNGDGISQGRTHAIDGLLYLFMRGDEVHEIL